MEKLFERTELLLGSENLSFLKTKKIAVFGVGGVGGYVCESLVRAGIGSLTIVDKDVVSETNINRQIIALYSTVGKPKVQVMKSRLLDINPNALVNAYEMFFLPETSQKIDFSVFDYVVDAVDNVTAKIEIIKKSKEFNVPVITSMGTGNKKNPFAFKIADVSKTKVCPLARVMRHELAKRGITKVKCLYSEENPVKSLAKDEETGKAVPGSISFVPSVAGILIASEVVKDLLTWKK